MKVSAFKLAKGPMSFLPEFLSAEEIKTFGKLTDEARAKRFKAEYLPLVKGLPRVREVFLRLKDCGQKFALASPAKGDESQGCKTAAGIDDLIDRETSSKDADSSKSDPDIFKAVLEKLGNPHSEEAMAVGDTRWDIEAARKAGLRAIAVRCGGFKDQDLAGC